MRKVFVSFWLGMLLSVWMLAIAPSPGFAAELMPQTQVLPAIEHFLTDLPNDYYTITDLNTLKRITKTQKALLIDVRQPAEYASGHIPQAINIPLQTLTENLAQIPQDRPVIFYCTTGYRTAIAVMTLQMLGYANVRGFPPSFQGWKAAGEPLE